MCCIKVIPVIICNCVDSHVCCVCDVYIPRSHTVAVPVGVDVDGADAHVLLAALVGVYVMVAQDNTPSSRAAQENFKWTQVLFVCLFSS